MRSTAKRKAALGALALLACLVLAEGVLRLLQVPQRLRPGWGWSDSQARLVGNFRDDPANQLGFRGQPIRYDREDYVVVLLGDGQVEAAAVPPERMPEKLLQSYLAQRLKRPVKVFSLAASGFGQDQQLLALERYNRKYRADLVLVWATPDDDFWENSFPDRSTSSAAGRLKPTYRLVAGELEGPWYRSDFYLGHSALLQLGLSGYVRLRGNSLEQLILERWLRELPASHEVVEKTVGKEPCAGLIAMGQREYAENRYKLNPQWRFLLLTSEDYYQSRSHFSPFLVHRSPRDHYLVEITRKLYQRIGATAREHHSGFKVFHAEPGDSAHSDKVLVQCVQNLWEGRAARRVVKDEAALLRATVAPEQLVLLDLPGGPELSGSGKERLLSDLGNDRAMKGLAERLAR